MSTYKTLAAGAAALALSLTASSSFAQLPEHLRDYPLSTRSSQGESVAPFFNGWIKNDDGSVTMVFGFANQNREAVVDVPLGANNFIEPAEFDGAQPTHFPIYDRGGFRGISERGAFAVTVPADQAGIEVVWTLTSNGETWSVPGRATSAAYEMSREPRALGSLTPAIRFDLDGAESNDQEGIYAAPLSAKVGEPLTLSAYVKDRGAREQYPENEMQLYPLGTEWIMHQGPAAPDFEPQHISGRQRAEMGDEGSVDGWTPVQTQATFWEPGNYVVRLRVDNFTAPDSGLDCLCCWSNAYVPVTVSP